MTIVRRGAALLAATALIAVALISGTARAAPSLARPTHVAIVVAGQGQACVSWHSGMTGADVLGAAFAVTWGRQPPYLGFVLQINGHGAPRPDDEHYWSYWQNSGGGWTYSGRGATSADVQPGTIEGWSYVDGSATASPPPAATYATVCAGKDSSPTPTRHPPTTAHRPSSSATHAPPSTRAPTRTPATTSRESPARTSVGTGTSAASATRTTTTPATVTSAAPNRPSTTRSAPSVAAATTPVPRGTVPARTAPTVGLAAAAASATGTPAAHGASDDTAALPSWSTALALLVVAAVGGAALVRLRGSRR